MQADTKLSKIEQTRISNGFKWRPFSPWRLTRNDRREGRLAGQVDRHGVMGRKVATGYWGEPLQ